MRAGSLTVLGVLAVAACARPAPWRPPAMIDVIEVHGDLIVRGEADETISVAARVALDEDVAFGIVRLRRADVEAARTSPHVVVARARGWQALARRSLATPARAGEAARRGAAALPACAEERTPPSPTTGDDERDAASARGRLEQRLRCYGAAHRTEIW